MIKIIRKQRRMAESNWQAATTPIYAIDIKEKERSHSEIKKYWELYLTDETVFGLINGLTTLATGPGFTIEGEGNNKEIIEQAFSRSWPAIHSLVRNALIFGNGFGEIIYTRTGQFHSLEALYPLDIDIENENGSFSYIHRESGRIFGSNKIFNLVFFQREDSNYGLSLLKPLYKAVLRKEKLESALVTAVERHLPRLHVILKQNQLGHYPSENERRAIARLFSDLKPEYEIVTTDLVEINTIDIKGVPNIDDYLSFMLSLISLGAQTPIEILGAAEKKVTHATARIRANVFFAGPIAYLQRTLEHAINSQILQDTPYRFRIKEWQMPLAYTGK